MSEEFLSFLCQTTSNSHHSFFLPIHKNMIQLRPHESLLKQKAFYFFKSLIQIPVNLEFYDIFCNTKHFVCSFCLIVCLDTFREKFEHPFWGSHLSTAVAWREKMSKRFSFSHIFVWY